jgi:hypothetical protein
MTALLASPLLMSTRLRTILALVAVLALGAAAALASGSDVIRDCAQDGQINKHYSQAELRDAEQNLPSDIDEYTDCRAAIRAAMGGGNGATGGRSGIVTPSGAVAGSQADIDALQKIASQAEKGKRSPVQVGGRDVVPGSGGLGGLLGGLQGANGMPGSLVAAIAALVLLAVVTAYLAAREKVPLVRRVALRLLGR